MEKERTLVLLKPGILQRRLAGEVLNRFERKGLKIIALKMLCMDKSLVELHYAEHKDKRFYNGLVNYMTDKPIIAIVLEGEDAIELVRLITGDKHHKSQAGSIRGDYAANGRLNIIHASDSAAIAEQEIARFFKNEEIFSWADPNDPWLYDRYD
ncbi:MAG: nucleoside-diphosphate kinase [Treponema sp.]|jgi:nucleoside-diphosphate kinase|nr:nucleoside-diphosphate kinase [Treponema sp.]